MHVSKCEWVCTARDHPKNTLIDDPSGIMDAGVGRAVAASTQRKVRAPQDKVPGNAWGARAHGQCHRKHTADGLRAQVRVKRCGKSAPRDG